MGVRKIGLLSAEPSFIGENLKGSDATTRRYASTTIDLLPKFLQLPSGRTMNQWITL